MLTPKELYDSYSITPCSSYGGWLDNGRGTPFDLNRIIKFLKHVKYPCYNSAKKEDNSSIHKDIDGTGADKLAVTFRFLQQLDIEAFAEGQPQINSGTAYAVRNGADLARACYFRANNLTSEWTARMATEYLEHFCGNSLPDCLMMLAPNLVDQPVAYNRTPSSLGCFYYGASSRFFCYLPPGADENTPPRCVCGVPPESGGDNDPCLNNPSPCCRPDPDFENDCCSVGRSARMDFSYNIPIDDINVTIPISKVYFTKITTIDDLSNLEDTIANKIKTNEAIVLDSGNGSVWVLTQTGGSRIKKAYQKRDFILKSIGIIERDDYGGYANFATPSGSNFNATIDDIFLNYFRSLDLYKCKTISTVLDITKNKTSISTNSTYMLNSIKDLIYNGYGIVLFSNVGFSNVRDSTGLSYPDRIWYQTYNIVGYDDRKTEYSECVYVLSCPFGDWISGGQPSWGPLPPSCFLVTESHLRCMISFYPGLDFYDCRKQFCNKYLYDCTKREVMMRFAGCEGAPEAGKCTPYYCTDQQRAFGMVFAISLSDGFPKQELPHSDFYPVTSIRQTNSEQTVYFNVQS